MAYDPRVKCNPVPAFAAAPQQSPQQTATPPVLFASGAARSPESAVASSCIRDVWCSNLQEEMHNISAIVDRYKFISVDTEFPGVVVTPLQCARGNETSSYQWKTIRSNVNMYVSPCLFDINENVGLPACGHTTCSLMLRLKIIQLGITFADQHGNKPPGICTWQFNFHFDINSDMYAQDSLEMLERAGIDFDQHCEDGIDVHTFAEMMISSGLVLNDENRWVAFHSGYDFGYLLKVLTNEELPELETDFFEQLRTWFGNIYDLKFMVKSCPTLNHRAGLNQLASEMKVDRIGPAHQAGSDSLVTCTLFFKLIQSPQLSRVGRFANVLYGLGEDAAELQTTGAKDTFEQHPAHTRNLLTYVY